MKKIIFVTALLIAATSATFAGSNLIAAAPTIIAEKNISTSIRSQIQFPDFLRERDGEQTATIIFKVNTCGTINVQEIQTDDEDLRANLMLQAQNIKVNTASLDTRDTYKVVVRFKTL